MKYFQLLGGAVLLLVIALQGWWWLVAVSVAGLTFFERTAAIVVAAFLYDAYLGAWYAVPFVSIGALGWYMVSESVRPWVRKNE